MLVLSRKMKESIRVTVPGVGGASDTIIDIMVVDIRGDKVRVGLMAPREVVIMRDELLDQQRATEPAPEPTR